MIEEVLSEESTLMITLTFSVLTVPQSKASDEYRLVEFPGTYGRRCNDVPAGRMLSCATFASMRFSVSFNSVVSSAKTTPTVKTTCLAWHVVRKRMKEQIIMENIVSSNSVPRLLTVSRSCKDVTPTFAFANVVREVWAQIRPPSRHVVQSSGDHSERLQGSPAHKVALRVTHHRTTAAAKIMLSIGGFHANTTPGQLDVKRQQL